jgi:hypothetical protein
MVLFIALEITSPVRVLREPRVSDLANGDDGVALAGSGGGAVTD